MAAVRQFLVPSIKHPGDMFILFFLYLEGVQPCTEIDTYLCRIFTSSLTINGLFKIKL